jgi:hypothetical protein
VLLHVVLRSVITLNFAEPESFRPRQVLRGTRTRDSDWARRKGWPIVLCSIHSLVDLERVNGPSRALDGRWEEEDWKSAGCQEKRGGWLCCCYGARTRFGFLIYDDVMNRRHKARQVFPLPRSLSSVSASSSAAAAPWLYRPAWWFVAFVTRSHQGDRPASSFDTSLGPTPEADFFCFLE